MLRSMRSGKFFKYIFLALLAMAGGGLVLMDVQGVLSNRGGQQVKVAEVDGSNITGGDLDRLVKIRLQSLQISSADAYRAGLPFRILSDEINSRMFSLEAEKAGLLVDNATAAVAIKEQMLGPLTAQGMMPDQALQFMLGRLGVSEAQLMQNVRMEIAAQNLLRIVSAGAYAPDQLVNDAIKYRNESRRGEYFTLNASEIAKVDAPSADEIEAFYQRNQSRYMLPEYRTLHVLLLDAKALGVEATVTDADIQAYYDEHIAEYSTPETREIAQVSVDTEEEANKIHAAAVAAKSLDAAVKSAGKEGLKVVTASYTDRDIPEELAEVAFKTTNPGEIAAPVKTPFGWHIVQVVKVTTAGTKKPLAEVRGDIEKTVRLGKMADDIYARAGEVDDMIAGGSTMQEIAAELSVKPVVLEKIEADGISAETQSKPQAANDLPMFDKVLEYGFAQQLGELSTLIETQDGAFMLVAAVDIFPPAAKPLAEVKNDVIAGWKEERKNEALDKTASEIMTRVNLGEKLEDIAKDFDKKVLRSKSLRRDSDAKDAVLGRGMIPALFSLDRIGQTTTVRGENSLSFLRLSDRKIDMSDAPEQADLNKQRLSLEQSLRNDLLSQYRQGLMNKFDVEVNLQAVEEMYASNELDE